MKKVKIVIGLNRSMELLNEAKFDQSLIVYCFEPNPEIVKDIKIKFDLPDNYKIIQKAVSDFNGFTHFNICSLDSCSSLMDWGNGPKFGDMKKIKVECIRMDTFIEQNSIEKIEFVIIDTQGNDLNVLKGFGEKIKIVDAGICESMAETANYTLYHKQPIFLDFVNFFKKNNFFISYNYNFDGAIKNDEVNIEFKRI